MNQSSMSLIPLGGVDLGPLYQRLILSGAGSNWRSRGRTIQLPEFEAMAWGTGDASFAVRSHVSDDLIGVLSIYTLDWASLVGSFAAIVEPGRSYEMGWAFADYVDYCFSVLGLRKLICEVPETVVTQIAPALNRLECVVQEGVLRQNVRIGGRYCDQYMFGILVDEFEATIAIRTQRWARWQDTFGSVRDILLEMRPDLGVVDGGLDLQRDLALDSLEVAELFASVGLEPFETDHPISTVQDIVEALEGSGPSLRPSRTHEETITANYSRLDDVKRKRTGPVMKPRAGAERDRRSSN